MAEVAIEERAASPREAHALRLGADAQVTVVTRVIAAGGQRVAHLVDVVPQHFLRGEELRGAASRTPQELEPAAAPVAQREAFHGSVLDYLLARGWPVLSHSHTGLSAEAANSGLAHALGIARGAAVLTLEAQLHAVDGQVVDYSVSHFVPGHFRLHVVRRIG